MEVEQEEEKQFGGFQLEQLEEYAEFMRADLPGHFFKRGWLSAPVRCVQGSDVYRWIVEHAEESERGAWAISQAMIDQEILQNATDRTRAEFEPDSLYAMYMDRDDIPDNLLRR